MIKAKHKPAEPDEDYVAEYEAEGYSADDGEPVGVPPDFRQRLLGCDVRVRLAKLDGDLHTVAFVRGGVIVGDYSAEHSAASIPFIEDDCVRAVFFDDVPTVQAAWTCVLTYWRQQGLPMDDG